LLLLHENKYLQNMFYWIRFLGVILMLFGITDATLRRFFDIHILDITGATYFIGLLGILLVEVSTFINLKNSRRWKS
jgi:hypothetical protein